MFPDRDEPIDPSATSFEVPQETAPSDGAALEAATDAEATVAAAEATVAAETPADAPMEAEIPVEATADLVDPVEATAGLAEAAVEAAEAPLTVAADPAVTTDPEAVPDDVVESEMEMAPAASDPEPSTHADQDADAQADAEPEPAAVREPATVAELVAATLRAAGVRIAFTVPGESFLPVLDALAAAGIRIVATRHEGAAAMAAEAYGQLTGRPAACLGTRVVGAANLAIGIHTATADSTPMFVLVGQVDRGLRGREAFQESDLVGTIGALAKWAGEIDDPATAAATLEAAVRATVEGRPGPAFLSLPEDVLDLPVPEGTRAPVVRAHPETPSAADVRAVLHFLAGAERPLIIAGAGVLRARCSNDLVRFAELLHVPVVASWRRGDVIPNDHPLYLGMTGFGSPAT
ncbi:MAG: thiamine pyrophosphate-binding protein, partial [Chloroflexota bacterium]